MSNPIEIYQSQDGKTQVSVQFEKETVWLSQAQMATLFGKDVRTINEHIANVFAEGELEQHSTIRKFRIVRQEGSRQVSREIDHYDLDMIISIGYRVKSPQGVAFRRWATARLKDYLVKGYALNERRLQERGIEFEQVIGLLSQTLANQALVTADGQAVLNVVQDYARSWSLLQAYDEQSLQNNHQKQTEMISLDMAQVWAAIAQLKQTLIEKGEATELFGNPRNEGLASAVATIEQGFDDELFYPNVASRAANLLYFVIKNHPLTDGNKRTGSFLFLWYLRLNQHLLAKPVEQLINDNTLVALALLVAESLPEQKELMIKLIEHFILLKA
ncbi:Death-on-curing protein [Bibersteinia trehalosi USDA-ARS-USMARC-189]|uniref:Death-on-curing protein n=1 Tax=Bibersteinia trehalosi USDA-ARS-USMARC-189 TaxID=1263831 RepID=A0ABN4C6I1_BIBTR|nr:virulence protein RhuM/Fic/DOC family protein [Bibersteinia trehalosi]AGH37775.1 Death-on-curing protein [Bibersteinia trehalosi USDA-ARS-USMARC-192]AHG84744.1 Death-on-curing protein [Bibersteinia trehalosi USDA-ARS-USMARC-189]